LTNVSLLITQRVEVCAENKKPLKLLKFIDKLTQKEKSKRNKSAVLIFVNQISTCDRVFNILTKRSLKVGILHGKIPQEKRESALSHFKCGKIQVLIATDVAARGLNISHLPYIINFDFPSNLPVYIHRIGRTGRQGNDGYAYSLFTRNLIKLVPDLINLLQEHKQWIDPNLRALVKVNSEPVESKENKDSGYYEHA